MVHVWVYVWVETDPPSPNRHAEHLLVSNFKDMSHLADLTGKVRTGNKCVCEESSYLMHNLAERPDSHMSRL